jgi:hypothetical protein
MVFINGDRFYWKRMNEATSHLDSWLVHNQNIPLFQVFMMINTKIMVYGEVMSCSLVDRYQHFGKTCYLQLQVKTMQHHIYEDCEIKGASF